MERIDSHQHFWLYNSVKNSWITDEMSAIQRDFLPEDGQNAINFYQIND